MCNTIQWYLGTYICEYSIYYYEILHLNVIYSDFCRYYIGIQSSDAQMSQFKILNNGVLTAYYNQYDNIFR